MQAPSTIPHPNTHTGPTGSPESFSPYIHHCGSGEGISSLKRAGRMVSQAPEMFSLTPRHINFLSWSSIATNCSSSQLTNNVAIVSDAQQRNSAIYIHVSILPETPPPIQADIEHWAEFFMLYNRTLFVIHVKYSSVYMSIPNSLTLSSPHSSWLATADLFSESVSLFLFAAVVKTRQFQCRRHRFVPWSGSKIPHDVRHSQINKHFSKTRI